MHLNERGLAFDTTDLGTPWRAPNAPVLLLHGIGTNRLSWGDWVAQLAPHHPVIRFDLRGFGASGPLPAQGDLLDVLVEDVLSLMPGHCPTHLVGESAGGAIMLATALRHPQRVASVTISNAAIVGRQIGQIDGWRPLFAQGIEAWSDHMMQCRFAPGALDDRAWRWYASQQRRTDPASALAIADMLAGIDLRAALPTLRPPLLVLHPDASPFVPLSVFEGLLDLLPSAQLEVYRGVRHGLPFSHGVQCAQRVLAFLAQTPAAGGP